MRRFASLPVILFAVCLSCNKTSESLKVNSRELPGVWEIRYATGGEPAHMETHYSPGNGHLMIFGGDSCLSVWDSTVYSLGAYRVDDDGINPFTKEHINRLHYTNTQSSSFDIKNDTLNFYPDENMVSWGYFTQYVKVSDDTNVPYHP